MVQRTVSERLIDQGHRSMIIETVTESPDSRRVAYVARAGGNLYTVTTGLGIVAERFVVVDGQKQKQYGRIHTGSLLFSHDSQRLAYVARAGKKWFVVVDGQEQKQYDGEATARAGLKWLVVKQYEWIKEESARVLSPDGRRLAYLVDHDIGGDGAHLVHWVVEAGKKGEVYASVGSLLFSPDSKRLAYVAYDGRKSIVVVDGHEGNHYHGIMGGISFDSPDQLHYMARKGNAFYLVEERFA